MLIGQTLFKDLFQQQWLQRRVELFADVLQQEWIAKADAVLKMPRVVGVGQLDDGQVIVSFHVLCPTICLTLWVYHQRPVSHSNSTTVLTKHLSS